MKQKLIQIKLHDFKQFFASAADMNIYTFEHEDSDK